MVLAGVASVYMVYWLRPVLVPFVVACFIVSGLSPILNWLERRLHVSKMVAAGIAFLAGILMLIVFGITVWGSLLDLSANSAAYRNRVQELVREVQDNLPNLSLFSNQPAAVEMDGHPAQSNENGGANIDQLVDSFVRDGIAAASQTLLGLASTSVVVLIYVFFLLLGNPTYAQSGTVREIDEQIRSYLSLKTVISLFTGLAFGFALRAFGVPMALTLGMFAFLLNFIPNVGPIVASLLPIPLIIFAPDGTLLWMLAAIGVTSAIQVISGNVIEPKMMGDAADLHPVSVLLALMFWGMMWGIVGMFLATPITAAVRIVMDKFEPTRPIGNLLAGRWTESTA
jgi:AI-2 transport protein TqsA